MAKGENIFKRKDGRWEARYKKGYDADHKILYGYCYGHTYREAKEKVTKRKAAVASNSKPSAEHAQEKTFAEFCDFWLHRNRDSWKSSTISKYESMLDKHILPEFGQSPVSAIDAARIAAFSSKLLHEKQLAAKTVRDILSLFHKITTDMSTWSHGMIKPVTVVYPKTGFTKFRVLTSKEQNGLTTYLKHEIDIYKFSILLSLTTGLRVGEVCGLRWRDFSAESNTIAVIHTVQRIRNPDKTGEKKTILQLGTPKTYHSNRIIPLTDGMAALCKQFSQNPDFFILTGSSQYTEPRTLQRKLKLYTKDLKMQGVHFHTLRHTFATRCIEVGCDIKTLSEILGHSSITMTMNRYVHPNLELKRKNIQKLEQAGFGCAVR